MSSSKSEASERSQAPAGKTGLTFQRVLTGPGDKGFDTFEWRSHDARIESAEGRAVFAQKNVEAPATWSEQAVNLVAAKYFGGRVGEPDRERSVRQLISRVSDTITEWGRNDGYFRTPEDADRFHAELTCMLAAQMASFNSPVWFNVGIDEKPQCSACFINAVDDTMSSILDLAKTEGMLFKRGSGAGSNLSALRSSQEPLSSGGTASGPVSFMRGFDAFAGIIKSGGRTRRAAKLVCLDVDHPDIREFIDCKADEERKAWALIDAGYDGSFNGEAYASVSFQNANNSVRVPDEFMRACEQDGTWTTVRRTDGNEAETLRARALLRRMAEACHVCGDPGMQFDTTINRWHTCKKHSRIRASNPCCFTGETEVLTTEGRIRIDTLARMSQAGAPLPGAVILDPGSRRLPLVKPIRRAWKAGEATRLVEVATYEGVRVLCTPEHRFYLPNGEHIEAQRLVPGQWLDKVALEQNRNRGATPTGDQVTTVRELTMAPTAVYDIEVEQVHRFAVSNPDAEHGLVVSNSEYMFVDDSACNLASINLLRCTREQGDGRVVGDFDPEIYAHVARVMITAMEIIVGNSSYPREGIEVNSHRLRPLGLGYTNLGALLMTRGVPYDSEAGRHFGAALAALLTAEAYTQSAVIARDCGGPFTEWDSNRDSMLEVIGAHREAAASLADAPEAGDGPTQAPGVPAGLAQRALEAWERAEALGTEHGYRNAQASVIAPTGTISFMMDCETTGIEPDVALTKYKRLVGGGEIKMVNRAVAPALANLGYPEDEIERITEHVAANGTIEGSSLRDEHLPVFDCALQPRGGERSISADGHLRMVGAVQQFVSGAISKTINMPNDATVDQIEAAYTQAWKLGLKSISVYRDGSKRTQPLSTSKADTGAGTTPPTPKRRKLPDTRSAVTHKFDIAGHKGYITVGMYDDGSPGELFLVMAKEGSTISGFGDSFAQATSYALQYGVPLQVLVDKFSHVRFEPSGMTRNPDVRIAKSIVDYVFRWLASQFLDREHQYEAGLNVDNPNRDQAAATAAGSGRHVEEARPPADNDQDGPPCATCGAIMVRTGVCYACTVCGATSGCG